MLGIRSFAIHVRDQLEFLALLPKLKKILSNHYNSESTLRLTVFPKSRLRYIRLFPKNIYEDNLNFSRLNIQAMNYLYRKVNSDIELCISSDVLINMNEARLKRLSYPFLTAFIWNDELEIEFINSSCKGKVTEFESFFNLQQLLPDYKVNVIDFGNTFSLPRSQSHEYLDKEGVVFFAGQVNPHLYDDLIHFQRLERAVSEAREFVVQTGDPFSLFSSGQFWSNFDGLTLTEIVAIRHKVINEWRLSIFKELCIELGSKLHLMGSDFESPVFKGAIIIPRKENLSDIYKSSRINLDLGSQCGAEYIYPRTLEILHSNPKSLAPFERRGQIADLPISLMTWNSVADILEICRDKQVI